MLPIQGLCATAFCVLLYFVAFRHRCDVYAARTIVPPLYGRLIARWRHGRWCHRCGKEPCFYPTRGPTGSLLVMSKTRISKNVDCMIQTRDKPVIQRITLYKTQSQNNTTYLASDSTQPSVQRQRFVKVRTFFRMNHSRYTVIA